MTWPEHSSMVVGRCAWNKIGVFGFLWQAMPFRIAIFVCEKLDWHLWRSQLVIFFAFVFGASTILQLCLSFCNQHLFLWYIRLFVCLLVMGRHGMAWNGMAEADRTSAQTQVRGCFVDREGGRERERFLFVLLFWWLKSHVLCNRSLLLGSKPKPSKLKTRFWQWLAELQPRYLALSRILTAQKFLETHAQEKNQNKRLKNASLIFSPWQNGTGGPKGGRELTRTVFPRTHTNQIFR